MLDAAPHGKYSMPGAMFSLDSALGDLSFRAHGPATSPRAEVPISLAT